MNWFIVLIFPGPKRSPGLLSVKGQNVFDEQDAKLLAKQWTNDYGAEGMKYEAVPLQFDPEEYI